MHSWSSNSKPLHPANFICYLKCSLSQGELVSQQLGPPMVATVLNVQVFLPIHKLNNFSYPPFPSKQLTQAGLIVGLHKSAFQRHIAAIFYHIQVLGNCDSKCWKKKDNQSLEDGKFLKKFIEWVQDLQKLYLVTYMIITLTDFPEIFILSSEPETYLTPKLE